jgi:hypothetical protein
MTNFLNRLDPAFSYPFSRLFVLLVANRLLLEL